MYCSPKNSDYEKTSRRNSILTLNNQYRTSNLSIYQVYLLAYTNSSTTWNRPLFNPDSCWMISIYFILFVFSHLHIRSNLASSSRPTFVNLPWKKTDRIWSLSPNIHSESIQWIFSKIELELWLILIRSWLLFDDWFRLYFLMIGFDFIWFLSIQLNLINSSDFIHQLESINTFDPNDIIQKGFRALSSVAVLQKKKIFKWGYVFNDINV